MHRTSMYSGDRCPARGSPSGVTRGSTLRPRTPMISDMVAFSLALALASLAQGSPPPATPPRPDDPNCVVRGALVDLEAAPAAGIELTLTATPRPRRGSLPASAPTPATPLLTTRTGA